MQLSHQPPSPKSFQKLPKPLKELCSWEEGSQQAELQRTEKELDLIISIQAKNVQNYLQAWENIDSDVFILYIVKNCLKMRKKQLCYCNGIWSRGEGTDF